MEHHVFWACSFKNFRGIEDISLDFKPGVNILLGDNGTGKTTILEALERAMGGFLTGNTASKVRGLLQDDFRWELVRRGGASGQIVYHSPSIEFDLSIEGRSFHGTRIRTSRNSKSPTVTKCSEIQKYIMDIANELTSNMPILSYMGISRVADSNRVLPSRKVGIHMNDRRNGYTGCLESIIDKNRILEWIRDISYESRLNEKEMPELRLFQKVVSGIMKEVSELDQKPEIQYSALTSTSRFFYHS